MEALRSAIINNEEDDNASLNGMYGPKGFFFQQRRGHLDLRGIAHVNMDRLIREVDIDSLQQHIENITFCNLREDDLRYMTDPQIVKLFRLSQLTIEYLLYSQDQLVENMNSLTKKYSAKKRGLLKKRQELAELQESTKHLRNQVKAKKQNIATLEELLKESNRAKEQELRKLRMQKDTGSQDTSAAVVRFFVAGPEGICVEFSEQADTPIGQLKGAVNKAFVSRRDAEYDGEEVVSTKLVFKGRLLMDDQTIQSGGIRNGDTLMVLIERSKPKPVQPPTPAPTAPQPDGPDQHALTQQMMEFLAKQQQDSMRELAKDINAGWQTAVQTLSVRPSGPSEDRAPGEQGDSQALADLNTRWSRAELNLRQEIEELTAKQAAAQAEMDRMSVLAMRRKLAMGDLESDEEPHHAPAAPAPAADSSFLYTRMDILQRSTDGTSSELAALRALLEAQARELEALKKLLAEQKSAPPSAAPSPARPVLKTLKTEKEPPRKKNRWNNLTDVDVKDQMAAAVVAEPKPAAPVAIKDVQAFDLTVEKTPPKKQVSPPPKPEPAPEPAPEPESEPEPMVVMEELEMPTVDVVFPYALNPDLMLLGRVDLAVNVPATASADDLVFEMRNALATKGRLPFGQVLLEHKGKRVVLGMDLDSQPGEDFTAEIAAQQALSGELRVRVLMGSPVTNAQIDMLMPSWQKTKLFSSSASVASSASSQRDSSESQPVRSGGSKPGRATVGKRHLRRRRQWGDEEAEGDNSGSDTTGGPRGMKVGSSLGLEEGEDEDEDEQEGPLKLQPGMLSRAQYRGVRGSLDEVLSGVSDKEGLTDEELNEKVSKMKNLTSSLPVEITDYLRSYKGSVAGALAAAAADSGSDTGLSAGEDVLRASRSSMAGSLAGSLAGSMVGSRGGSSFSQSEALLARSVSRSISLARPNSSTNSRGGGGPGRDDDVGSDGGGGGEGGGDREDRGGRRPGPLRLSSSGGVASSMASSMTSEAGGPLPKGMRRSIEQFDREHEQGFLSGDFLLDDEPIGRRLEEDSPMLASLTRSADFKPRAAAGAGAALARVASSKGEQGDTRAGPGTGGAAARDFTRGGRSGADGGDGSDMDESSLLGAHSNFDANLDSPLPRPRAEAKHSVRDNADSVDSFKKMMRGEQQRRGSFKDEEDDQQDAGRDRTMLSSIRTLDGTMESFLPQQQEQLLEHKLDQQLGDLLSTTLDSDGDLLLRDSSGGGPDEDDAVRRRADEYERKARAQAELSAKQSAAADDDRDDGDDTVEQFEYSAHGSPEMSRYNSSSKLSEGGSASLFEGLASSGGGGGGSSGGGGGRGGSAGHHEGFGDESSVNSLALSDSNNLEDDI